MKKTMLVVAVASLLVAQSASAYHYGMAGCGLGSLVFQDQKGPIQIVAGILNATGVQTFGITTGTSNCHDGDADSAALQYIESNQAALKEDVSRGQGETLAGLLTMWGCQDGATVGSTLKSNFSTIYSPENIAPIHVGDSMKNVIRSQLSNSCAI